MNAITHQPLLNLSQVVGPAKKQWPFLKTGKLIACHSGRAAIYQACQALNLNGPGRVLVPAYHCGAEVAPYQASGLTPEFYPIRADLSTDLEALEASASLKPDVKVIHLTHFFGFPGPVDQVANIAARYNLPLIEDAAHGLFSQAGNRPLGSDAAASIFSLPKTLPVSDGGLLRLPPLSRLIGSLRMKRPPFVTCCRSLRRQAAWKIRHGLKLNAAKASKAATTWERVPVSEVGFDPLTAHWSLSLLSKAVLARTDWQVVVDKRRANYQTLLNQLVPANNMSLEALLPDLPAGVSPWVLPLKVRDPSTLATDLKTRGVAAWPVWAYFHPLFDPKAMPEATDLKRSIIALPIHQDLTEADCCRMAKIVLQTVGNRRQT